VGVTGGVENDWNEFLLKVCLRIQKWQLKLCGLV